MPVAVPSPKLPPSPPASPTPEEEEVDPLLGPDDGRRVTLEEYWEDWYEHPDHRYEWNNGILEAKPVPTRLQDITNRWFMVLLGIYVDFAGIIMVSGDFGFKLTVPDPDNPGSNKTVVRKPDHSVVLPENQEQLEMDERSFKGVFDLVVEVLSDSAKRHVVRDTVTKRHEYQAGQVREYYIIDARDPKKREKKDEQVFLYADKKGVFRPIPPDADGVIHSRVLKGFRFRRKDLERRPTLPEMLGDPVYDFVLPDVVAELEGQKRAIAEKDKALAENAEVLAKKDKALAENAEVLAKKDQALAENAEVLAKKDEQLAKKDQELAKLRETLAAVGKNPNGKK